MLNEISILRPYEKTLTKPEVAQRLARLERALELKALDSQQAGVDRDEAESAARLIEALRDTPEAVMRMGSLLVIKVTGPGGARVVARTLTTDEMIAVNQKPSLLESPQDLLDLIGSGALHSSANDRDSSLRALPESASQPQLRPQGEPGPAE